MIHWNACQEKGEGFSWITREQAAIGSLCIVCIKFTILIFILSKRNQNAKIYAVYRLTAEHVLILKEH